MTTPSPTVSPPLVNIDTVAAITGVSSAAVSMTTLQFLQTYVQGSNLAELLMTTTLPSNLTSTDNLVRATFPQGIPEVHYLPLLCLLSEQLSFRNVAHVVAHVVDKDYGRVYNEVLGSHGLGREQTKATVELLEQHGYEQWLKEEE